MAQTAKLTFRISDELIALLDKHAEYLKGTDHCMLRITRSDALRNIIIHALDEDGRPKFEETPCQSE